MYKRNFIYNLLLALSAAWLCEGLTHPAGLTDWVSDTHDTLLDKKMTDLKLADKDLWFTDLSRQVMLQQFSAQERVRSEGSSGVKQRRVIKHGPRSYYSSSYTDPQVCAIHEHSNHIRTVGMGEFIAVLNGFEFRTRHNDFKLVMPHPTSAKYHEVIEIPYPEVPKAVTDKASVEDQIIEMREWFKAWRDEDSSTRDYTKHFKPILCYLEGAWTVSDDDKIEESFDSDRHKLDAKSWHDLLMKVRFTSYTGKKDPAENYAFLPTTIMSVENGTLVFAQWNYRILCHPLKHYLEPSRLCAVDDLHARMALGLTLSEYEKTRSARFKVTPVDKPTCRDQRKDFDLLDALMQEVPGMDNYQANLTDDALDSTVLDYRTKKVLNAGYYHNMFRTSDSDAMGATIQFRGFSDENVYMAMTTQPKIAEMSIKTCHKKDPCKNYTQRWTYAIPLEIIYLTPLYNWNPYNVTYKGHFKSDLALTVTADGRNGEKDPAKAYNGTHQKIFYMTPTAFYQNATEITDDAADTEKGNVWVLDANGTARQMKASGTRILTPEIPGVGSLRLRYPIMPTHQEGSVPWKETEALKDILLHPKTKKHMFYEDSPTGDSVPASNPFIPPSGASANSSTEIVLNLRSSDAAHGRHSHTVTLTLDQFLILQATGTHVTVNSSVTKNHYHELEVTVWKSGAFAYDKCDHKKGRCADKHPFVLKPAAA